MTIFDPGADLAVIVLVGQHDARSPESVDDPLHQLVGHEAGPGTPHRAAVLR